MTLIPSDVAFSSRSACWTSSVTAWPLMVWYSVVPCFGNVCGGVCCAKLRFACAISASKSACVMCVLPTTATSSLCRLALSLPASAAGHEGGDEQQSE